MDTRDGRIYQLSEAAQALEESAKDEAEILEKIIGANQELIPEDKPYLKLMGHHPTPVQRARRKVGRNETCPCGSGIKFKKCCLFKKQ